MKKFLPLILTTVVAVALSQGADAQNRVLTYQTINHISPNGRWAASEAYGEVIVQDLQSDVTYRFQSDSESIDEYTLGNTSAVANDGTVIGGISMTQAAYMRDGVWTPLNYEANGGALTVAYSITADGRRITGLAAPADGQAPKGLSGIPGYWDRQKDGSYGDFQPLPYPSTDFTGRVPQYVSAIGISNDGSVIAGQVHDYSGMINNQPIVYRKNANGEWSYELIHYEMINPTGVKFPEEILPEVEWPDPAKFIVARLDEYNAAQEAGEWPDPLNYLTPSEYAEYEKATIPYKQFLDQTDEINALVDEIYASEYWEFTQNDVYLSADGRYYATSGSREWKDPNEPDPFKAMKVTGRAFLFDLTTGTATTIETEDGANIGASFVGADGTVLASSYNQENLAKAFIFPAGAEKAMPIESYVKSKSAETYQWMVDNMTHNIGYDYNSETFEPISADTLATGIAVATPDLKLMAMWSTTDTWMDMMDWDPEMQYLYVTYLIDMRSPASIDAVAASVALSAKRGAITVEGDASSLVVYDLNGKAVMTVANPTGTIATADVVAPGFYIIKAIAADDTVTTIKATL